MFAIALVCGLLLFSPTKWLSPLGLNQFVDLLRPWIGIVFLITVVLCILDAVIEAWKWGNKNLKDRKIQEKRVERLYKLTAEEKEILLGFILNKTRTQYLAYSDGVVRELEAENIVFRSSDVGDSERWSYNIQPWVWDIINSNIYDFLLRKTLNLMGLLI